MKQRLHIPLLLAVCLALTLPSGCRPDTPPVSAAAAPCHHSAAAAPPACADSGAGRVECRGLVSCDRAAHMAGETVSLRIDSGAVRFSRVDWDSIARKDDGELMTDCDGLASRLEEGCIVDDVSQAKPLSESGDFLRFDSEVHRTSSSYGEDWVDISTFNFIRRFPRLNIRASSSVFGLSETFSYDTAQVGFYRFNIAEVERRASSLALPRCSNVIEDNGKEKDPETGFLYYGARYHWPEVWSGWLSPDPMMDKYPGISPYAYCNWNPVIFVDPDGRDCNPVYDIYGVFLGTDDNGLQGEMRVLSRTDFKQNMNPEIAKKKNLGTKGFVDKEAYNKVQEHYRNLPYRVDYDGKITLDEANSWYRKGSGDPLFADINQIDLSGVFSLGEKFVNQEKCVNLLTCGKPEDGLVYGKVTLKRTTNHGVRMYADTYNFDMKSWWNPANWGRNVETMIGGAIAGEGKAFDIHIYGTAKLKPILPWIK